MLNRDQIKTFLPEWIWGQGGSDDVAFSSRIRLARNLRGFTFPGYANDKQLTAINQQIEQAVKNKSSPFGELSFIRIEELNPNDRVILVEKHLCSPQFVERPHLRSLAVNQDQNVSLMINEEDHLRIQTIIPGFSLDNALDLANLVDDFLEETLEYSFDENCGYLTACPTNVGTGIRASVMLHLPGLTLVDQVKKVLSTLTHVGINIRGLYGEGTEAIGDLYQISNQITLGRAENELTNNLKSICRQVIEQERSVREALMKESKIQLEDRLCRSYGLLTQARMLSSQEALKLLSDLKLGVEMGILPGIDKTNVKELFFLTRASILQKMIGDEVSPAERDYHRASVVRERLSQKGGEFYV